MGAVFAIFLGQQILKYVLIKNGLYHLGIWVDILVYGNLVLVANK